MTTINPAVWTPETTRRLWVTAAVCGVILGLIAVTGHRSDNDTLPGIIGACLSQSGIVWAIAYYTYLRARVPKGRKWGAWFAVFVFAIAANYAMALNDMRIATGSVNSIQATMNAAASGKPLPQPVQAGDNDMAKLAALVQQNYATLAADQHDYDTEVEALDSGALLTPDNIRADPTLVQAQYKAKRLKEIVAKYRGIAEGRYAQLRQSIAGSNFEASVKQSALNGYDKSHDANYKILEDEWTDESRIADLLSQNVDLVARERGKWHLDGALIRFDVPEDLASYNASVEEIKVLGAQEVQRRKDLLANENQRIETLKAGLHP